MKRERQARADFERKPQALKFFLLLAIMGIALVLVFLFFLKPQPSNEIIPADKSTTIEVEPEWEDTPVSTAYFYQGDIFFGGSDDQTHNPYYFYFSNFEEMDFEEGIARVAVIGIDMNDFYFLLDNASDRFAIMSDGGQNLGVHEFIPGKVSEKSISFGVYPLKYNYYVTPNKKSLFLLLSAQEFPMQFSKTMWFKGTDSLDAGNANLSYFLPAIEEFGFSKEKKAGTAIFSFDEDEDSKEDIFLYLDTFLLAPLKPDSRDSYKWQVVFPYNERKLGFNLEKDSETSQEVPEMKQDSYGSILRRNLNSFSITMPAKGRKIVLPEPEEWTPEES
ncbi:MAG: hypothetical protein QXK06_05455 [Candidatus Diapherotrites archaeon]